MDLGKCYKLCNPKCPCLLCQAGGGKSSVCEPVNLSDASAHCHFDLDCL